MKDIEAFDKLKTKVLKYILYKKRTEAEVKKKFTDVDEELLSDVIEELKEQNYINDSVYIEKLVSEYLKLKNMSIKELEYKLQSKGLKKSLISNYISNNKEILLQYELTSIKNIFIKKQNVMLKDEINEYLRKKGYMCELIKIQEEELDE